MPDMEKVIKGLECCKIPFTKCYNGGCPYFENEGCKARLKGDALALLKAQATRVLTLDEYKAITEQPLENRVPVWLEWRGASGRWTIPNRAYELYGESWRCWTSRPTDEQREKEPWNG